MNLVRRSFRTRLLLTMLGLVAVLLAFLLVAVRRETGRQVAAFETRTAERAGQVFDQLERFWQEQLGQLGRRVNESARVQAALVEGDSVLLGHVAADELVLAGIPRSLAVLADDHGEPIVGLLDGEVDSALETIPLPRWVDRLERAAPEPVFGYEVVDGRLYVVQATLLTLFQQPVGALLLGFPVEDADAQRLGEVVEAEVCFGVGDHCVAATPGAREPRLQALLVRAALPGRPSTSPGRTERWALVSQPLAANGEAEAWRAVAVPLEAVLAPFERIQRVATLAGLLTLAAALLLSLLLSRGLTRPVEKLVEATRRVAGGDYEVQVESTARDEIGALAAAFNRMTEGLRLKERYRGILDKVVSPDVAEELLKGEIRLGGETREVTTLFADIRGFTARTEGMEPQAVLTMLNEYLAHATAAVEAEGGVVDKYVGDAIVAIFGAPVRHEDDASRAVRAALGIRAALEALNPVRAARGEAPLEVGIGINTGPALAGNVGTERRMNYTVIGETVNLAARLCDAAGRGQILISAATRQRLGAEVRVKELAPLRVKGLSYTVPVFEVEAIAGASPPIAARATFVGLLAALLVAAPQAQSQESVPAGALSAAGPRVELSTQPVMLQFAGRLELEGYLPEDAPAWLIEETHPFVAGRASLFGLAALGERVSALVELRADRGQVPADGDLHARIQQAFVDFLLGTPAQLRVQAGKFVTPLGLYAQRRHTAADPFIRPPLPHDYRTVVSATAVPAAADGFLNWKDESLPRRRQGTPVVWSVPYPTGAAVDARLLAADVRLAVVNSAPSAGPDQWAPDLERAPAPSLIATVGYQPLPELRLGIGYSQGPYLDPSVADVLPAGRERSDFAQRLWNGNVAFSRGWVEANGEVFVNRWEVPNLPEAVRDLSYFLEAKVKVLSGAHLAGRFSAIDFDHNLRSTGERERWDHPARRWQVGAAYRLARGSELRAEYQSNRVDGGGAGAADLVALQWWWAF